MSNMKKINSFSQNPHVQFVQQLRDEMLKLTEENVQLRRSLIALLKFLPEGKAKIPDEQINSLVPGDTVRVRRNAEEKCVEMEFVPKALVEVVPNLEGVK